MRIRSNIVFSLIASLAISLPVSTLALLLHAAYIIAAEGNFFPQPDLTLTLAVFITSFTAVFTITYTKLCKLSTLK